MSALAVFGGGLPSRNRLLSGAWGLMAAGYVAGVLADAATVGVGVGTLFRSGYGAGLVRDGIAVAVTGAALAAALLRRSRTTLWVLAVAAAATAGAFTYSGHAAAAISWRDFKIAVQWLHVLAVGAWIGGLVSLLYALVRRSAGPHEVRRFSLVAGWTLAVVVVTGTLRAVSDVGSWSGLVHSAFGITLLVKLALVAAIIALGAWNRYRHVPAAEAPGDGPAANRLRAAIVGEVALGIVVFGVTGVLAGLPPPGQGPPARVVPHVTVSARDVTGTLRASLTVSPARPGPNSYSVSLTDPDTGKSVAATRVGLRMAPQGRPDVGTSTTGLDRPRPGGGSTWTGAGSQLSLPGTWDVTVVAETAQTGTEIPLRLPVRAPPQKVTEMRMPGAPTIYTVSLNGGGSVQSYIDPGKPGSNEIHVTFFDAAGQERPIDTAGISYAVEGKPGTAVTAPVRRFSDGHFVADVDLPKGRVTVTMTATGADAARLDATYTTRIG